MCIIECDVGQQAKCRWSGEGLPSRCMSTTTFWPESGDFLAIHAEIQMKLATLPLRMQ